MSDLKQSWWKTSSGSPRRGVVGMAVLASILTAVCCFVWLSPGDTVAQTAKAVGNATAQLDPLAPQNNSLKAQVASLKKQLDDQKNKSSSQQAAAGTAQASAAKSLAEMQQKLTAAQSQLAQAAANAPGASGATVPKTQSSAQAPSGTKAPSGGKAPSAPGSSSGGTGSSGSGAGSGPSDGPTPPPLVVPTRAQLLAPAQRYDGMYTQQAPFNWATFDQTSAEVGVQPNLVGYFDGWDEPFRASAVTRSWQRGVLPMLTWESRPIDAPNNVVDEPDYTLPKILSGAFDSYLEQYAQDIVATGLPLAIRFDHEMNGTWYPWSEDDGHGNSINGNDQGDYVKVWQHVHDIFQAAGANQYVIWVWSPNIVNNLTSAHQSEAYLKSLYPGDDYVDWVGLSGYLRPPYKSGQQFTFDYTFGQSLDDLRQLTSKPIILSEVGASETGGHKPDWITSFFDALAQPQNSDIIGFGWFDESISTYIEGQLGTNDWRIDSRPESLAAFIAGLTRPEDNFALIPASS